MVSVVTGETEKQRLNDNPSTRFPVFVPGQRLSLAWLLTWDKSLLKRWQEARAGTCSSSRLSRLDKASGVEQEPIQRQDEAWAPGTSEEVVLREGVSHGSTWRPQEMVEPGPDQGEQLLFYIMKIPTTCKSIPTPNFFSSFVTFSAAQLSCIWY